jgi:hypothetical protein
MITADYLHALMVLVVLNLMRWNPENLRNLLRPVALAATLDCFFLESVPTAGNGVVLDVTGVLVSVAFGAACGDLAVLRPEADGSAMARCLSSARPAITTSPTQARRLFARLRAAVHPAAGSSMPGGRQPESPRGRRPTLRRGTDAP